MLQLVLAVEASMLQFGVEVKDLNVLPAPVPMNDHGLSMK